jgi:glycosyltransferase involved in cell wall biosynthesis
MTTPSVAVLIPSYNHGRYIEETLGSVYRQTLRPQELHVIDDGSIDDSVEVIERALAGDSPIRRSLKARGNRGISATRNELCAATTTDFVAFLDSDDLYAPNRLERMLESAPVGGLYFAFSGVDFLCELEDDSVAEWHDSYHGKLGEGMSFPTVGFALLRSNFAISASNFVMSRRLFDMVGGFDDRIKICQDWDFAVRAMRFVEPTFIPESLLTYRIHSRNTSRNAHETSAGEIELLTGKLCEWVARATPNSLAPTPRNWPRYFRIFAHLNASNAGRALAAQLPAESLLKSSVTAIQAAEAKAIRDLISAARLQESTKGLSRDELMLRCHQRWSHSR